MVRATPAACGLLVHIFAYLNKDGTLLSSHYGRDQEQGDRSDGTELDHGSREMCTSQRPERS
jgi:hypothetical protein